MKRNKVVYDMDVEQQNLHKAVACQHLKLTFVIHRGASAAGT